MGLRNALDEVEYRVVAAARAAGTSNYNTTPLDMAGYESVMYIIPVSTHTNAGTVAVTFAEGATTSAFNTLTATSANITGTTVADSQVMLVDIVRPTDRYNRATITRATQNSSVGPVMAMLYGASKMSVTQSTTYSIDDTDQSISPTT